MFVPILLHSHATDCHRTNLKKKGDMITNLTEIRETGTWIVDMSFPIPYSSAQNSIQVSAALWNKIYSAGRKEKKEDF